MTSHAPMAVEALCALGRGDAIAAWIERYRAFWPERIEKLKDVLKGMDA